MTETTPRPTPAKQVSPHRMLLRSRRADPARTGAIAPTSRRAAAALARSVPATGRPVVLELGAGTGSITRALHDRLPTGGRVIAVESDADLAEYLRESVPGADPVCADARDLEAVLDDAGVHRVDAVISSLPLTLMPSRSRASVLSGAARRLDPDGEFVTITYQPSWSSPARMLATDMADVFTQVFSTGPVWANLPPGRLVHGRGPRSGIRTT